MRPSTDKFKVNHGTSLVSWLLLLMAIAVFAPCVLLPEWRAYQQWQLETQRERHRLDQMERVVDRERRHLDALRHDPAVLARLAQRDLRFRERGDVAVRVATDPPAVASADELSFTPQPVVPPAIVREMSSRLPAFNYDRVFCDSETRIILICMSLGLMLLAIYLPTRRAAS